jgi:hypothetical protein
VIRGIVYFLVGNPPALAILGISVFWMNPITQGDKTPVFNQPFGVKIMRMVHVDVTIEIVEAVLGWVVERGRVPNSPFPHASGSVTCFFKQLGYGGIPGTE